VDEASDIAVEKSARSPIHIEPAAIEITLALGRLCRIRLDGLLSRELSVTRNRLGMLLDGGHLAIRPLRRNRLSGPAVDGQEIAVVLDASAMAPDLIATIRRRALL
jgi:hypothetical protein